MIRNIGDDMDKVHNFYISKEWRELSYNLKIIAEGKCKRCGAKPLKFSGLIGHHWNIELTEDNVDDVNISLNPNNVEIICKECHNKEHRRFGNKQNVYIVYGSPLSGKNTIVSELMQYGDIVLDIDAIYTAITGQPEYIKPKNVRFNVFKLRDSMLEQIKMRYGQWYDAYVIGGYPDKYERERLAKELGAELIYCESTKEVCLERMTQSGKPIAWIDYINDWWKKFER